MRTAIVMVWLLTLTGCLETKAKLTWHEDGSIDLVLTLTGDALKTQADLIIEQLRNGGFYRVKLSGNSLSAEEKFKEAGWDRWSGWIPGRFVYQDPSGLAFARVSRVIYEDYSLSGTLDTARLANLSPLVVAMGLPFTFEVEAPWPALRSNADEVEGKTYVWKKVLGQPFAVYVLYRRWYPERVVVLALLLGITGLALWCRLRPRRSA
ncbi:hypothetical protein [Oceanithermus sp.]